MALSFKKAVREKIWLKILLSSPSGGGKSYSALRLANGIADKCDSRIAYIGTEGSRDLYYSNEFDYDLIQLEDPFTIDKYIEAIDAAIDANYKVLIIDSISAEWAWLNDTHDRMQGNSFTNWGKLKPQHQKFIDKILLSPIHVVCTARGKDEWVLEDSDKGKKVPKLVGLGSQQDKNIQYNYTVTFTLAQDTHIATATKDNTHIFTNKYDVLTEKDGAALYDWANSSDIPATVKEPPKYEAPSVSAEDELKAIKKDIVAECVRAGGSKNEELMAALKEFVPSGNPNAIKSIDKAKECLTKVKGIKSVE